LFTPALFISLVICSHLLSFVVTAQAALRNLVFQQKPGFSQQLRSVPYFRKLYLWQ
jgi:hypothetical protein